MGKGLSSVNYIFCNFIVFFIEKRGVLKLLHNKKRSEHKFTPFENRNLLYVKIIQRDHRNQPEYLLYC